MVLKLDKNIECYINEKFAIDVSVLRQIEELKYTAKTYSDEIQRIIEEAPKEIEEPEKTDSLNQNLINRAKYEIELKEKELKTILDEILLLDVFIDEIDEVLKNIDKCALVLVKKINEQIKVVRSLYNDRINLGCRNNLSWEYFSNAVIRTGANDTPNLVAVYKVVKNVGKIEKGFYGLKYYRKPSNVDYKYKTIKDFVGYIKGQSNTMAIIGSGGTSRIELNDKITYELDSNSTDLFYNSEIPKVIGFGTTSVIGIHTTINGRISVGSTILAITGIGSENNPDLDDYDIKLNDYVVNIIGIATDSKVVGFGSTTITVGYVQNNNFITTTSYYPTVLLDKSAFNSITDVPIEFGTYSTYPSIILNQPSISTLDREAFEVVRQIEDASLDFDYTSSPSSPIRVGIIKNDEQLGYGHTLKLIDNGNPSETKKWKVFEEDEPKVGNDVAIYYEGNTQWPYYEGEFGGEYAIEGRAYIFDTRIELQSPGYATTNRAQNGINPNSAVCVAYGTSIIAEETKLQAIEEENVPKIEKLVSISMGLRSKRDKLELRAWGLLQAASYNRGEIEILKSENIKLVRNKETIEKFEEKTKQLKKNEIITEIDCPNIENL